MASPRTRLLLLAGALASSLALTACGDEVATSAPLPTIGLGSGQVVQLEAADGPADDADAIEQVVMIGDSITNGAMPALEAQFATLGLPATIVAENGKRMAIGSKANPSGADVAAFVASDGARDHRTEVWVVALGTNDAGQYGSPDEITATVDAVLDAVPDEAALVWVDTHIANRTDDSDEVNAIIRDRVERRGNSVVVPWSSVAPGDGVLSTDAVHPTTAGSETFASLVAEAVRTFLGR